MAKCPKCRKNWKWDWFHCKYYDENNKPIKEIEIKFPEQESEIVICQCGCGKVLSAWCGGEGPENIPQWGRVNWNLAKNSLWKGQTP